MHLFYHVDHGQWQMLDDNEQREAKTRFTELIQEIRTTPDTQLLTFAVATPKADLGFMLITPVSQRRDAFGVETGTLRINRRKKSWISSRRSSVSLSISVHVPALLRSVGRMANSRKSIATIKPPMHWDR